MFFLSFSFSHLILDDVFKHLAATQRTVVTQVVAVVNEIRFRKFHFDLGFRSGFGFGFVF